MPSWRRSWKPSRTPSRIDYPFRVIRLGDLICRMLAPIEDRYYLMATIMLGFATALVIIR